MQGQDGDVEGLLRGSCRKAKDDVAGGLGGSPRALWKDFPRRGRRDCSAFPGRKHLQRTAVPVGGLYLQGQTIRAQVNVHPAGQKRPPRSRPSPDGRFPFVDEEFSGDAAQEAAGFLGLQAEGGYGAGRVVEQRGGRGAGIEDETFPPSQRLEKKGGDEEKEAQVGKERAQGGQARRLPIEVMGPAGFFPQSVSPPPQAAAGFLKGIQTGRSFFPPAGRHVGRLRQAEDRRPFHRPQEPAQPVHRAGQGVQEERRRYGPEEGGMEEVGQAQRLVYPPGGAVALAHGFPPGLEAGRVQFRRPLGDGQAGQTEEQKQEQQDNGHLAGGQEIPEATPQSPALQGRAGHTSSSCAPRPEKGAHLYHSTRWRQRQAETSKGDGKPASTRANFASF